jgi:putative isomerase
MSESLVPLARAWNSWDAEHPAEMTYLPLGLRVGLCAYASSINAFTRFPAGGEGVRLGPRSLDGDMVHLDLAHAGTTLAVDYDKPDHFTLRGRWKAGRLGEWGLRFWVILLVRLAPPEAGGTLADWSYDPDTGTLSARHGPIHVVLRGTRAPLLATFHESVEAVQAEFESKGYFYLGSRGVAGPVAALRYHLEEMPEFAFAATLADDRDLAASRAAAVLEDVASPASTTSLPRQAGTFSGALDAVRDVIGWNTVWDAVNRRPYTSLSRNWVAQKFGGFGVWLDDVLYHALLGGFFDLGVVRENWEAVLAGARPQGNLPCLMTGRDSWVDRTQPPIAGFLLWMTYLRSGTRELLERAYPTLLANHDWWFAMRDGNGNGLMEYGTSPVGDGLYRGTKLAAKDESSMDNSPTHDEAKLDTATWTLDCEDVGLNSLIALDGEMLALIATELGDADTAVRLVDRTDGLKARIRDELWDESREVFASRLWSGAFVRSLAPTSFYPLLAGAASPAQAAAMLKLLTDPEKFGGEWLLPSVTRDDPAFGDNVYWRGRIWPPLNFLVYHGLKRSGFAAAARALAENSVSLFMGEWHAHRRSPENFSAVTGEACDQPDTDPFYGWGALMPALGVAEVMDVTPWSGWEITHAADGSLGPVLAPGGRAIVESVDGVMTVLLNGRAVLRTNLTGRFRQIVLDARIISLVLPAAPDGAGGDRWLEFPAHAGRQVLAARLGGGDVAVAEAPAGLRITVSAGTASGRLELVLADSGDGG